MTDEEFMHLINRDFDRGSRRNWFVLGMVVAVGLVALLKWLNDHGWI